MQTTFSDKILTCAYLYPLWGKQIQINSNEKELNNCTEWVLLKKPPVYFSGHTTVTSPLFGEYNCCDSEYIDRLIFLCEKYGIDALIICWYWDQGHVIDDTILLQLCAKLEKSHVKFGLMWVQRRSHASFPIMPPHETKQYHPEVEKRIVRTSISDLKKMASTLVKYFSHSSYLWVGDHPIFIFFEVANLIRDLEENNVKHGIAEFRGVIENCLNVSPFLLGIIHHRTATFALKEFGFDGATNYVFLPDWGNPENQNYLESAKKRQEEWKIIEDIIAVPYFPSVTAGWDASSRGQYIQPKLPYYPWSPIVTESNPLNFHVYLKQATKYVIELRKLPRLIFIASMNEWSEGHAIEPSLRYNFHFLEAIRETKSRYSSNRNRSKIAIHNKLQFALITDIDGTLIPFNTTGMDLQKAQMKEIVHEVLLKNLLVYVTGRTLAETYDSIWHQELPEPDIIVADVGTTWCWWNQSEWINHPFQESLNGFPKIEIRHRLAQIKSLKIQNIRAEYRVSYFVNKLKVNRKQVEYLLKELSVDCLWSKNYLDVLPKGVNKLTAAKWIVDKLPVNCNIILAGDSANDEHLYLNNGDKRIFKIVMPPYEDELISHLQNDKNCFFAQKAGIEGILEGIKKFNLNN